MIVRKLIHSAMPYEKEGRRRYRMTGSGFAHAVTDCGVFSTTWEPGFLTDGRSGGVVVDPLFPNWGTDDEKAVVIMHDILFHDFDISFETANELLRGSMLAIGCSGWRAGLVYRGVSTPIGRSAFGCKAAADWANKRLCNARWFAREEECRKR